MVWCDLIRRQTTRTRAVIIAPPSSSSSSPPPSSSSRPLCQHRPQTHAAAQVPPQLYGPCGESPVLVLFFVGAGTIPGLSALALPFRRVPPSPLPVCAPPYSFTTAPAPPPHTASSVYSDRGVRIILTTVAKGLHDELSSPQSGPRLLSSFRPRLRADRSYYHRTALDRNKPG